MELVKNLPVIFAAAAAILAGLQGFLNGAPNTHVYGNMCLFLVVFYLVGALIRHTVTGIFDEIAEKNENVPVTEQLFYDDSLGLAGDAMPDEDGQADDAGDGGAGGGVRAADGSGGVGEAGGTGGASDANDTGAAGDSDASDGDTGTGGAEGAEDGGYGEEAEGAEPDSDR